MDAIKIQTQYEKKNKRMNSRKFTHEVSPKHSTLSCSSHTTYYLIKERFPFLTIESPHENFAVR